MFPYILIFFGNAIFADSGIRPQVKGQRQIRKGILEPPDVQNNIDSNNNYDTRQGRGFKTHIKWTETDSDGKIVIPFSMHENIPEQEQLKIFKHMGRMNDDLGCVKTVYVAKPDLLNSVRNPWRNGILFVWPDISGGGCWSSVGKTDGNTGNNGPITKHGTPEHWQFLALDPSCTGASQRSVEHEMLHALGFDHEHNRPDRDTYLNVDTNNAQYPSEYTLSKEASWLKNDDYPFELESVMTYCSFCGALDPKVPVMTLKNSETFSESIRMTTTDSLQLIWGYCQDMEKVFQNKETTKCPTEDRVVTGFHRDVYVDRICDGFVDCPDAADELGELGLCIPAIPQTASDCCASLLIRDYTCNYKGNDFEGRISYECHEENVVVFSYGGNWYFTKKGLPGEGAFYYQFSVESDTTCPPIGKWGDDYVFCKSSGPDTENGCDPNPGCSANANCVDLYDGYRCDCKYGFEANGKSVETNDDLCTEIPQVNECDKKKLNTCHKNAICTDTLNSYTCACMEGFTDTDTANPGRSCVPCCQSIQISKNIATSGSLIISVICDKVEPNNNDNYFSYDCHSSKVSVEKYNQHALPVPATIVYIQQINKWFFMEDITSSQALASTSLSYLAFQDGLADSFCPVIGNEGKFSDFKTNCLEYYVPPKTDTKPATIENQPDTIKPSTVVTDAPAGVEITPPSGPTGSTESSAVITVMSTFTFLILHSL